MKTPVISRGSYRAGPSRSANPGRVAKPSRSANPGRVARPSRSAGPSR
jgi:hypothetical protein